MTVMTVWTENEEFSNFGKYFFLYMTTLKAKTTTTVGRILKIRPTVVELCNCCGTVQLLPYE